MGSMQFTATNSFLVVSAMELTGGPLPALPPNCAFVIINFEYCLSFLPLRDIIS
jgi:hypothetical protein